MTQPHTPGPWSVEDPMGADVGLWIVQSGLEPRQWSCIAMVTDDEDGQARDEGGRFIGRTEREANARLIAAAPEMFRLIETLSRNDPNEPIADSGETVFDLWKHDAKALLARVKP